MKYSYDFSICKLYIAEENGFITRISFSDFEDIEKETPLINNTYKQLREYFDKKRKIFNIPLKPKGTSFQLKVWRTLLEIPYGKTASYKDIAKAIGNEKASRAVGLANKRNPIAIIIPCHRVIGSNRQLTGYAGGINIKEQLLKIEK